MRSEFFLVLIVVACVMSSACQPAGAEPDEQLPDEQLPDDGTWNGEASPPHTTSPAIRKKIDEVIGTLTEHVHAICDDDRAACTASATLNAWCDEMAVAELRHAKASAFTAGDLQCLQGYARIVDALRQKDCALYASDQAVSEFFSSYSLDITQACRTSPWSSAFDDQTGGQEQDNAYEDALRQAAGDMCDRLEHTCVPDASLYLSGEHCEEYIDGLLNEFNSTWESRTVVDQRCGDARLAYVRCQAGLSCEEFEKFAYGEACREEFDAVYQACHTLEWAQLGAAKGKTSFMPWWQNTTLCRDDAVCGDTTCDTDVHQCRVWCDHIGHCQHGKECDGTTSRCVDPPDTPHDYRYLLIVSHASADNEAVCALPFQGPVLAGVHVNSEEQVINIMQAGGHVGKACSNASEATWTEPEAFYRISAAPGQTPFLPRLPETIPGDCQEKDWQDYAYAMGTGQSYAPNLVLEKDTGVVFIDFVPYYGDHIMDFRTADSVEIRMLNKSYGSQHHAPQIMCTEETVADKPQNTYSAYLVSSRATKGYVPSELDGIHLERPYFIPLTDGPVYGYFRIDLHDVDFGD